MVTFLPFAPFAAPDNPLFFGVGDFNLDGNQDIATVPFNSSELIVFIGDGQGGVTESITTDFPGNSVVYTVHTLDSDGDGDLDLILGASSAAQLVLVQNSGGVLQASSFDYSSTSHSVVTGDCDGDGLTDIVAGAVDNLFALLNTLDSAYVRGDDDADGDVDMLDPIHGLNYLFLGGESFCLSAQDTNGDGELSLGDPLWNLTFLFFGRRSSTSSVPRLRRERYRLRCTRVPLSKPVLNRITHCVGCCRRERTSPTSSPPR